MYLLKNPEAYLRAQKEVDEVVGGRAVEADDIHKLKYLNAVLRETARLSPTVPVLQKHINPENVRGVATLDGGRYTIEPSDLIIVMVGISQRDPKVWGETADDFIPVRMLDENFDKVAAQYPGCWKASTFRKLFTSTNISQPFGNGKRSCIGRPFAWQES